MFIRIDICIDYSTSFIDRIGQTSGSCSIYRIDNGSEVASISPAPLGPVRASTEAATPSVPRTVTVDLKKEPRPPVLSKTSIADSQVVLSILRAEQT